MTKLIDLINQIRQKAANNKPKFVNYGVELDIDLLARQLREVESMSPKRHAEVRNVKDRKYLFERTGITSSEKGSNRKKSNRVEEHLAIALWDKFRKRKAPFLLNGNKIELLDYQVPLKSVQSDEGVGKVDILGLINDERLAIVELKVKRVKNDDTPLGATLQALVYASIIKANLEDISKELQSRGYPPLKLVPPEIIVLGRRDYWQAFNKYDKNWLMKLAPILSNIAHTLSMTIQFIELEAGRLEMGYDGREPKLHGDVKLTVLYSSAVPAI